MSLASQYCTFRLDTLTFGIDVVRVQEVIKCQPMTRVPQANDVVEGLINLRGQIITAIDLRRLLGLPPRLAEQEPMNVVVRTGEGELSLLVDEIGDVVEVDDGAFETAPETLQGTARELLLGAYKLDDRLLLILDTDKAVRAPVAA